MVHVWLYPVQPSERIGFEFFGDGLSLSLEIDCGNAHLIVVARTVTCRIDASNVEFKLCSWTRVAVRFKKRKLKLIVGKQVFTLRSHYRLELPPSLSLLSLRVVRGSMLWSQSKKCPPFPAPSAPTPKRFCEPLRSVKELLSTVESKAALKVRTDSAANVISGLLVCHDFKGNYLESDRRLDTVFGGRDGASFAFTHWAMASCFVYFSHHRVSVPPPSWIAAARTNNCRLLGTFITEWREGESENVAVFSEPERAATALAQLAANHLFDGWLINIESSCPTALLPNVRTFLSVLRKHCIVVWYDSLTADTVQEDLFF